MAAVSPPKPWERSNGAGTSTLSTGAAPPLPLKPSSLTSVVNRTASNYTPLNAPAYTGLNSSPYGPSRYGASPYGGMGSYSSPYGRVGGMGSMFGGGYGSMYGGGYGGGAFGGMPGFGQPPVMGGEDPNSLSNSFSQSTQATFQIIESIVGAFGGFAQMLDSTYMATHSSFYAMIAVAEQFTSLRDTLGSILGIYTLLRWLRTLLAKVTGRPPPADATSLTPSAFARFTGQPHLLPDGRPAPPRPSKKPFFVFLLAAFGLPYLMGKLIRTLARSHDERLQQQGGSLMLPGPDGQLISTEYQQQQQQQQPPLDPSQLDFCRLRYDYTPEAAVAGGGGDSAASAAMTPGIDLAVKKGDLVAVLSRVDPLGNPSEWWQCRARDGRVGYLPGPYLELVVRRPKELTQGSLPGTRLHTLTSMDVDAEEKEKVPVGKATSEGYKW